MRLYAFDSSDDHPSSDKENDEQLPTPSLPSRSNRRRTVPIIPRPRIPSNIISKSVRSKIKPVKHVEALTIARTRLELAIAHGHAPSTASNYDYAIKRYLKFAGSLGFTEIQALPASEELILLWACEGLGRTGPGTAKGNLSALRAWHVERRIRWVRPECIALIMKALTEYWPRESKKRKIRAPITSSMMTMLASAWKDGSPKERCAYAIALTAWSGQARLGELLPPTAMSVDRKRLPHRSAWSVVGGDCDSSELILPWTKTTYFEGATLFLLDQRPPLNASHALSKHFKASSLPKSSLVCEYTQGTSSAVLDREEFMDMCNDVWGEKGLPYITGHSFRIGGTTALLCSGVAVDVVKKMGRWTSDAFLVYWRSLGHLFSQHASNLEWND